MSKYTKSAINFALSNILKDLNDVKITNKALVKDNAKETIKDLEKLGYDAVFKLGGTIYTVLGFDLNTIGKTWLIENKESITELIKKGEIEFIDFCCEGYTGSMLICNYLLETDFETGIITATADFDGEKYVAIFENGTMSEMIHEGEFVIEFFGAGAKVEAAFSEWKTQKDYDNRCELREWNNYHSIQNHL